VTDELLRNLERVAAGTGDVHVRARLFHARLRSGDLEPRQVRLAAYLGDPAAILAVEGRAAEQDEPLLDPTSRYGQVASSCALRAEMPTFEDVLWLRGLSRWGLEVVARAGIAWLRTVPADPGRAEPMAIAEYWRALDAWLADPTIEAYERVARGSDTVVGAGSLGYGARLLRLLTRPGEAERREQRRWVLFGIEEGVRFEGLQRGHPERRPELDAVKAELMTWALSSSGRRSLDDRPGELPEGPTFWQRTTEAETSVVRLKAIDVLCRHHGEDVTVILSSGEPIGASIRGTGVQDFTFFFTGGSPMMSSSLDDVLEVRPGPSVNR
jgi:hypothetical protein